MFTYNHLIGELARSGDPEAAALRRQRLRARGNHPKPLIRRAVYASMEQAPGAWKAALAAGYIATGSRVVGFGYNSTVVRADDTVYKVVRKSARMTHPEQAAFCDRMNSIIDLTRHYMGAFAIPESYAVRPHPIHGRPTVIGEQSYIAGFQPVTPADFESLGVNTQNQLAEFADQGLAMHRATGYVPDLAGVANIGINPADGQLRLIDTVSLPSSQQIVGDRALNTLHRYAQLAA
jgi:hypothetical protein